GVEVEVSGALVKEIGTRIESGRHGLRGTSPRGALILPHVQTAGKVLPVLETMTLQPFRCVVGPFQIAGSHDVGVGVVVHGLVMFVRPDDGSNMVSPARFQTAWGGPESSGLDQDLGARLRQELDVVSRLPVLPHGIGDVGADMMFL